MPIKVSLSDVGTPHFYLRERGFSPHVLARLGLGVAQLDGRAKTYGLTDPAAGEAWVVVIPYDGFDRIRLIDAERFAGGRYRQPAGCSLDLWDPLGYLTDGSDWVLLIEGELNLVAVNEADPDVPVVALPGQNALKPELAARLEHLSRVVVWLDLHDPRGLENLAAIRTRLHDAGVRDVRHVVGVPQGWDAAALLQHAQARGDLDLWRRYLAARLATVVPDERAANPSALKTITASTVTPRSVSWFWQGWIPLGMVSLLAGLPGLGKTTFALRIAADATRGELDGEFFGKPTDVLVASFEDVIDARLVPLLLAADADLSRVHFIACQEEGRVLDLTRHLPDMDRLAEHHCARLLFIDPLVAAMPAGEVSSHRDQDVRSVLAPLHALAERRRLAALASMHFSKSAVDALLGVGGSIGFTGLARSLLIFGADPNDARGEEGPARVLGHRKCNVGTRQRSRQVAILPETLETADDGRIGTSFALLGDDCDVSADDLVRVRDRKEPPVVHATRFLRQLLADGPHAVQEIQDLADDEGIAWRTVERAKRDLSVESFQKDRQWWWQLTPPEEQLPFDEPEENGE